MSISMGKLLIIARESEDRELQRIENRLYAILRPLYVKQGESALQEWDALSGRVQEELANRRLTAAEALAQLSDFVDGLESRHPELKLSSDLS